MHELGIGYVIAFGVRLRVLDSGLKEED